MLQMFIARRQLSQANPTTERVRQDRIRRSRNERPREASTTSNLNRRFSRLMLVMLQEMINLNTAYLTSDDEVLMNLGLDREQALTWSHMYQQAVSESLFIWDTFQEMSRVPGIDLCLFDRPGFLRLIMQLQDQHRAMHGNPIVPTGLVLWIMEHHRPPSVDHIPIHEQGYQEALDRCFSVFTQLCRRQYPEKEVKIEPTPALHPATQTDLDRLRAGKCHAQGCQGVAILSTACATCHHFYCLGHYAKDCPDHEHSSRNDMQLRLQKEQEERYRLLNSPPVNEPASVPPPMTQVDREVLLFNFALLRSLLMTNEGIIDPTVILDVAQLPSRYLDEDLIRQIVGEVDHTVKELNTNALIARVQRYFSVAAGLIALQVTSSDQALSTRLCEYLFESIQNTWAAIRHYHTHLMDIPEVCIPDIMRTVVGSIRAKWWGMVITGKVEWARDRRLPAELLWFLVAANPTFRIGQIKKFAAEELDDKNCAKMEKWYSIRATDRARLAARNMLTIIDTEFDWSPQVMEAFLTDSFDNWTDDLRPLDQLPAHHFQARIRQAFRVSTYTGRTPTALLPMQSRDSAVQTVEDFPMLATQETLIDTRYQLGEIRRQLCHEPGGYVGASNIPTIPPSHDGDTRTKLLIKELLKEEDSTTGQMTKKLKLSNVNDYNWSILPGYSAYRLAYIEPTYLSRCLAAQGAVPPFIAGLNNQLNRPRIPSGYDEHAWMLKQLSHDLQRALDLPPPLDENLMPIEEIFKKLNQQKAKSRRKFIAKGRKAESAQQAAADEEEVEVNEETSPQKTSETVVSTQNTGLSVPEPMSVDSGPNKIQNEAQAKTSETTPKPTETKPKPKTSRTVSSPANSTSTGSVPVQDEERDRRQSEACYFSARENATNRSSHSQRTYYHRSENVAGNYYGDTTFVRPAQSYSRAADSSPYRRPHSNTTHARTAGSSSSISYGSQGSRQASQRSRHQSTRTYHQSGHSSSVTPRYRENQRDPRRNNRTERMDTDDHASEHQKATTWKKPRPDDDDSHTPRLSFASRK